MAVTYQTVKEKFVEYEDGFRYTYRGFGASKGVRILCLTHFRATMDSCTYSSPPFRSSLKIRVPGDPLLINLLAAQHPIVLFDDAGVSLFTGPMASTMHDMAANILSLLSLLFIKDVDILELSMGGFYAPLIALNRTTGTIRKMILAGTGVSAGCSAVQNSAEHAQEFGRLAQTSFKTYEPFQGLIFLATHTSQEEGKARFIRMQRILVENRQPTL